jgi:hypothetical protein
MGPRVILRWRTSATNPGSIIVLLKPSRSIRTTGSGTPGGAKNGRPMPCPA